MKGCAHVNHVSAVPWQIVGTAIFLYPYFPSHYHYCGRQARQAGAPVDGVGAKQPRRSQAARRCSAGTATSRVSTADFTSGHDLIFMFLIVPYLRVPTYAQQSHWQNMPLITSGLHPRHAPTCHALSIRYWCLPFLNCVKYVRGRQSQHFPFT